MRNIALILDYHFNSAEGILVKDEIIINIPAGNPMPTEADLIQWEAEYNAYTDVQLAKLEALLAVRQTVKANAKLAQLGSMKPAQIQDWLDANITTLADVKDLLKTFAILIGLLAREL